MNRLRSISAVLLVVVVAVIAATIPSTTSSARPLASRQAEDWRRKPPTPETPRPFALPQTHRIKLDNGLTLVFVEDHRAPMITMVAGVLLNLSGPATAQMLMNRITVAEATAELLTDGAGTRNSRQLAQAVETLGGRISSSLSDDYAEVSAAVVSENAAAMLDLFADVLVRPTFPPEEIALYKDNRVDSLTVQRQEPSFLVAERFNRVVYGSRQYAITTPTPAAVRALTRPAIAGFYRANFTPGASVIVIAGDFNRVALEERARTAFAGWQKTARQTTSKRMTHEARPSVRQIYLISRPGSEQADFRIGSLAASLSDPDHFPLSVANAILGAGTGSRLFLNVREQKGFAYDVGSTSSALKDAGTFFAGAETRTEVAIPAMREVLAELDRLGKETVSESDLQNAKNFLSGQFSLALSTQGGVADHIMEVEILGLGGDYLERFRGRVEAVTADQVQAVARKYARPGAAVIVVVGDAAKLEKPLRSLGPVQVFDIKGRRLR